MKRGTIYFYLGIVEQDKIKENEMKEKLQRNICDNSDWYLTKS